MKIFKKLIVCLMLFVSLALTACGTVSGESVFNDYKNFCEDNETYFDLRETVGGLTNLNYLMYVAKYNSVNINNKLNTPLFKFLKDYELALQSSLMFFNHYRLVLVTVETISKVFLKELNDNLIKFDEEFEKFLGNVTSLENYENTNGAGGDQQTSLLNAVKSNYVNLTKLGVSISSVMEKIFNQIETETDFSDTTAELNTADAERVFRRSCISISESIAFLNIIPNDFTTAITSFKAFTPISFDVQLWGQIKKDAVKNQLAVIQYQHVLFKAELSIIKNNPTSSFTENTLLNFCSSLKTLTGLI